MMMMMMMWGGVGRAGPGAPSETSLARAGLDLGGEAGPRVGGRTVKLDTRLHGNG